MTEESPGASPAGEPRRSRWIDWLQFTALALLLLFLSEALWLWETWPVRDLLQWSSATPSRGVSR